MSNYSEFVKSMKEKELNFFFGEGNIKKKSNKYFHFKRMIDNDNIIIFTKNVKLIKDNYTLIVDNNKCVYLKEWQIKPAHNYDEDIQGYVVKLCRKYFKTYTFKSDFDGFAFEKEESFDDLVECAREQEEYNMPIALGHMG